jgi:hypothetical protein
MHHPSRFLSFLQPRGKGSRSKASSAFAIRV